MLIWRQAPRMFSRSFASVSVQNTPTAPCLALLSSVPTTPPNAPQRVMHEPALRRMLVANATPSITPFSSLATHSPQFANHFSTLATHSLATLTPQYFTCPRLFPRWTCGAPPVRAVHTGVVSCTLDRQYKLRHSVKEAQKATGIVPTRPKPPPYVASDLTPADADADQMPLDQTLPMHALHLCIQLTHSLDARGH